MTYNPFEVCNCSCHDSDMEVYHVMACCIQCPHCGVNIKRGHEDHYDRCAQERLSMGLDLNQYSILNQLSIPDTIPRRAEYHDSIREEIDREVLKEIFESIDEAKREESPAVKFLRECQERERKLGK